MTELLNKKEYTELRKKLRSSLTKGEVILWQHLKNSQLGGFKFRRQFGIGNYVTDFCCPRIRLVVEIDGLTHSFEHVFENDQKRQNYIESLGFTVKRYQSEQIFNNLEWVLTDLYHTCCELQKTTPRPSFVRRG